MSDPAGQENQHTMTATVVEDRPVTDDEDRKLQQVLEEAELTGEVPGNQVVHLKSRRGFLTIEPDQTDWTEVQLTALESIGIKTEGREAVPRPYVLQFLYVCQMRDLDPQLREAYLITYGNWWQNDKNEWVDSRKYSLVIGIEGFRKRGEDTGQYRGQTEYEWCGQDGVWKDFWDVKTMGYPLMARVGIFRAGFDVPVYGKAAFSEFCPMVDVWTYDENKRKKVRTWDRETNGWKKVPAEMWQKMGSNQLGKCAEAQGFRKAFPRQMNGLYAEDEMDRARIEYAQESEERARQGQADQAQQRRMAAYAANQAKTAETAAAVADAVIEGEIVDDGQTRAQQPRTAAQAAKDAIADMRARQFGHGGAETPSGPPVTDAQRLAWLVEEIKFQSTRLGRSIEDLTKRQSAKLDGKSYRDFTANELQLAVNPSRKPTARKLRDAGLEDQAAAYAAAIPGVAAPLWALLGQPEPTLEPTNVDPTKPHTYADKGGVCMHCGLFEDAPIHGETITT